MSLLLALLYPIAIQYERGGWWKLLAPITIFALIIDVIANYTELAIITWDFPKAGEWTFSQRLSRLRYDMSWRQDLANIIIEYLDFFDPDGRHV